MYPSSFFRLLSFTGLNLRRSAERQMGEIRSAMLSLLEASGGHRAQRIAQRVRFADDLEALWYLRQDLMSTLAELDGEHVAQRRMKNINRLFKGGLPQTMGPRVHHRFTV